MRSASPSPRTRAPSRRAPRTCGRGRTTRGPRSRDRRSAAPARAAPRTARGHLRCRPTSTRPRRRRRAPGIAPASGRRRRAGPTPARRASDPPTGGPTGASSATGRPTSPSACSTDPSSIARRVAALRFASSADSRSNHQPCSAPGRWRAASAARSANARACRSRMVGSSPDARSLASAWLRIVSSHPNRTPPTASSTRVSRLCSVSRTSPSSTSIPISPAGPQTTSAWAWSKLSSKTPSRANRRWSGGSSRSWLQATAASIVRCRSGRSRGPVPGSACWSGEAVADEAERQRPRARRAELDRQRQAVHEPADLADGRHRGRIEVEVRARPACPIHEEPDRLRVAVHRSMARSASAGPRTPAPRAASAGFGS